MIAPEFVGRIPVRKRVYLRVNRGVPRLKGMSFLGGIRTVVLGGVEVIFTRIRVTGNGGIEGRGSSVTWRKIWREIGSGESRGVGVVPNPGE